MLNISPRHQQINQDSSTALGTIMEKNATEQMDLEMDVKLVHNQSVDVVQNNQMSPSNLRSITMMNEQKNSIMKVENSIQEVISCFLSHFLIFINFIMVNNFWVCFRPILKYVFNFIYTFPKTYLYDVIFDFTFRNFSLF